MKRSKSNVPNPAIRILKKGACPSLSGKSTLTYQIGCTPESELRLRVAANTGGGFFSDEWVAFDTIQQAFDGQKIVSLILYPLFQGRSLNTPAFLLAVLKAEGLVQPLPGKQRGYERIDPGEFIAEVKALIDSALDLAGEGVPAPTAKRGKKAKPTHESLPSA